MTTRKPADNKVDEDQAAEVDYPGLTGTDADADSARELAERDATIAQLKAELADKRSTQQSSDAELRKALDALTAEVERMKTGGGLVPVPQSTEPDPYLYWARLGNGDVIELQHPTATAHHTDSHGLVPVDSVWLKDQTHASAAA